MTLDCQFLAFWSRSRKCLGSHENVSCDVSSVLVVSENGSDDYKNTRVTQVERCYAGWNKSWGGWYRAWNATSEPVKETDQSC